MVLLYHDFNAVDLGLCQDFNVCDEVNPVNVEDVTETLLVKTLEETYVTAVSDPG